MMYETIITEDFFLFNIKSSIEHTVNFLRNCETMGQAGCQNNRGSDKVRCRVYPALQCDLDSVPLLAPVRYPGVHLGSRVILRTELETDPDVHSGRWALH